MEFSIFAVEAAVSAHSASIKAILSENIFQEMLENIILSFADYKEKSLPLCSLLTPQVQHRTAIPSAGVA